MKWKSAHVDSFARDNLPPRELWPEFLFERPEFRYPVRLNCATELLDRMVSRGFGHRPVIRAPEGSCTYTELYAQANRIANVLVRDMGLMPGNRVLLRGPNNPMMAACWFAVMKAGGVCVATMPLLRAKELTDIISKAEITHALCDKRLEAELKLAQEACSSLKEVRYWYDDGAESVDSLAMKQPLWFTNVATAADDVALITFTSGTTGKPKGTLHFHRDVAFVLAPRGERDHAAPALDRLRRVVDEVQEYLVQLRRRAGDGRNVAEILPDRVAFQLVFGQQQRALEQTRKVAQMLRGVVAKPAGLSPKEPCSLFLEALDRPRARSPELQKLQSSAPSAHSSS